MSGTLSSIAFIINDCSALFDRCYISSSVTRRNDFTTGVGTFWTCEQIGIVERGDYLVTLNVFTVAPGTDNYIDITIFNKNTDPLASDVRVIRGQDVYRGSISFLFFNYDLTNNVRGAIYSGSVPLTGTMILSAILLRRYPS